MAYRLPSLKQLRVFEAAVRRESFTDAADELFVTQAAVSHQIKALEADLGRSLFRRQGRGVIPTEAARIFAREIGAAFDRIQAATHQLDENPMSGTLNISIAPFYGNRIVLPRLSRFHGLYPDIKVMPDMSSTVLDFRKSSIDAGLRYGKGIWAGVTARLMHADALVPVAAPTLVAGRKLPLSPAEIAEMMLGVVDGDEDDWPNWFAKAGFTPEKPLNMLAYGNRARVIDLAFSGHGVALADLKLTAADVAAGHLVRLNETPIRGGRAMYLVYPETEYPDPRVTAFGDWFLSEIEAIKL
jgi:LysR family glycine cleavage system transcriptional activator